MSSKKEILEKEFISDSGLDRFTKVRILQLKKTIELNFKYVLPGEYQKKFLTLNLLYAVQPGKDDLSFKLELDKPIKWEYQAQYKGLLQNLNLYLLLDGIETIMLDETWGYGANGMYEEVKLGLSINNLLKLALAKKIEYRINTHIGILSEGTINKEEVFLIKGFYASIFDEDFGEIFSQIQKKEEEKEKIRQEQIAKEEKQKKAEEENKIKKEQKQKELEEERKKVDEEKRKIKENQNLILEKIISLDTKKYIDKDFFKKNDVDIKKAISKNPYAYVKTPNILTYIFTLLCIFPGVVIIKTSIYKSVIYYIGILVLLVLLNDKISKIIVKRLNSKHKDLLQLVNSYIELIQN